MDEMIAEIGVLSLSLSLSLPHLSCFPEATAIASLTAIALKGCRRVKADTSNAEESI
jgi:hypothetical protein